MQPGDSLWGIARDFGWEVPSLAKINRLSSPYQVAVGRRLYVPPPKESRRFFWPMRGRLSRLRRTTSSGGRSIEISSPEGMVVRAARTGWVAVAAQQLSGFGRIVILEHQEGYYSVYAGLDQLLVQPGVQVRQGNPLGIIGRAPLYFEIRNGARPADPLRLLP